MMEWLLSKDIEMQVREVFKQLVNPVVIILFGKEKGCTHCSAARQLLQEVSELSDHLEFVEYDLSKDDDIAQSYNVDRVPCIVLTTRDGDELMDYGLRFLGVPAGHEFTGLIHGIINVSRKDSELSPQTRKFLQELKTPLFLQVFVTPT
jgi:alkyl hydroperoxide reductase subunit AhpF